MREGGWGREEEEEQEVVVEAGDAGFVCRGRGKGA